MPDSSKDRRRRKPTSTTSRSSPAREAEIQKLLDRPYER